MERAPSAPPTVSNPLGSIMPDDDRECLVRITRRHDVPIIEDDVYGELVFDGTRPRPDVPGFPEVSGKCPNLPGASRRCQGV